MGLPARGYPHKVIEVGSPALRELQHYLDRDPILYKKRKVSRTQTFICSCLLLDNGCDVTSSIESSLLLDFPASIAGPLNYEPE